MTTITTMTIECNNSTDAAYLGFALEGLSAHVDGNVVSLIPGDTATAQRVMNMAADYASDGAAAEAFFEWLEASQS